MGIPSALRHYHECGEPLACQLDVSPWICNFWPLAELEQWNGEYRVPDLAPGYLAFGSNGGDEMFAFAPSGEIVCLPFVGMSPDDVDLVATDWEAFRNLLRSAV